MSSLPRDEKRKENQRHRDGSNDEVVYCGEKVDEIAEASNLVSGAEAKSGPVEADDHELVEAAKNVIKAGSAADGTQHEKVAAQGNEPEPTLQDAQVPALSLSRQQRLGPPEEMLRPGAYHVHEGGRPHRASSVGSTDRIVEGHEQRNRLAPEEQPPEVQAFLAEASLVVEEDTPSVTASPNTSLLVAATPVRRSQQVALFMAAVVIAATITGMAVGLTRDRTSSAPAGFSPTSDPAATATNQFKASFHGVLPLHTIERLQDTSSPQYHAYEWVVKNSQALRLDPQDDKDLQRAMQLFALAALYFATGGETSWDYKDLWLTIDVHECNWYGCCCGANCPDDNTDDTGLMTWLDLSDNRLIQSVPHEIGLLTGLRLLSLANNSISGLIPTVLGQLTALTGLGLWSNRFVATIPSELGRLTNLVWMSLRDNRLTGSIPTELGQMSALTEIRLWSNQLASAIPTQLGLLTDLQILSLTENKLSGPIPTELAQLSALRILYLVTNQLTSTMPTQFGLLVDLEDLEISENALTGSIPSELGQLSLLRFLFLTRNQFTSTIPLELTLLTSLEDLRLHNNSLTGSIPTELGELSALTSLWLGSNQFNSTIPTHLGLLTNLKDLGLSDTLLSGPIPTQLGELSELTSMWLGDNRLNSTIPTELGLLYKLGRSYPMRLGNNSLSGSVPSELCQLKRSNRFDLYVDCQEVSCACRCSCSESASDDAYYYFY